jgi:hypothetical protein
VEIGAEAAQFPEKEYINGIPVQCSEGQSLKKFRDFSKIISSDSIYGER